MKKHYFVVQLTRIEVENKEGALISSDEVFRVVRKFRTRTEAEEFIRSREGYYLLVLEG